MSSLSKLLPLLAVVSVLLVLRVVNLPTNVSLLDTLSIFQNSKEQQQYMLIDYAANLSDDFHTWLFIDQISQIEGDAKARRVILYEANPDWQPE